LPVTIDIVTALKKVNLPLIYFSLPDARINQAPFPALLSNKNVKELSFAECPVL
jgi:hypothetical protein